MTNDDRPDSLSAAPRQRVEAVSVVIPVRNEASSVLAVLRAIGHQTLAPAQIVVVDGGSSDATVEVVQACAEQDGRIRLIEAGAATPGRGRNVGITAAGHEWVALTDAGARVEPDWLEHLVSAAERHPDAAVIYGNYEPVADRFFTRCAALAYVSPKRETTAGLVRGPSTVSMLLRRDAWRLVGGFPDLRAGEDLVFMERVAKQGIHVAWAPRATVWWDLQPTLAGTFRRFVLYSRHNVRAGLQRRWHYGVARQYLVAIGVIVLAVEHDWRWLLLLGAGLILRTIRTIVRRGGFTETSWHANAGQFLCVLAIVVTIDAATLIGWAQALFRTDRG